MDASTSVNRVLRRLEIDGVVRLRYGQVEILDATVLLTCAGIDDAEVDPVTHHGA